MINAYCIAGKTIRIISIHPSVHTFCRDYLADGEPDFTVEITSADLAYERDRAKRDCSDAYLETLAVYRKIAEKMPEYNTVLMHGSAVAVDGEAYLFTAKSGTGKSTHTRLWREVFGERAIMVNDDKPLVKIMDSSATVYGTPWNGKHRLSSNIAVPLKAVCILERAEENTIKRITKFEAYSMLIQQTYRPADPIALTKTLTLIDRLADSVSLYRLGCNMEREAAEVSYNGMKGTR